MQTSQARTGFNILSICRGHDLCLTTDTLCAARGSSSWTFQSGSPQGPIISILEIILVIIIIIIDKESHPSNNDHYYYARDYPNNNHYYYAKDYHIQ